MAKFIIPLICVVLAGVIVFALSQTQKNTITFTYSNDILDNPEKGFYVQIDSSHADSMPRFRQEARVVLVGYDLKDFTTEPISDEKIQELHDVLKAANDHAMGVVFRATYGFTADVSEPTDLNLIEHHMMQISEVLNEYKEAIMVVQAGILGAWGEWHSGLYLKEENEQSVYMRKFVLQQWEKYLDNDMLVSVRRTRFIREAWESGILIDRLGIYNDALLSTHSDMATYDDPLFTREQELDWMDKNLESFVNGGEMPTLGELNLPENADYEFQKLHLTYLNLFYNQDIIASWDNSEYNGENAKDYIENRLGYNLYVTQITTKNSPWYMPQKTIDFNIEIENIGYGALSENYEVYAVLYEEGKEVYSQLIDDNSIYQITNGEKANLSFTLPIEKEYSSQTSSSQLVFGLKITKCVKEDCGYFITLSNSDIIAEDKANKYLSINTTDNSIQKLVDLSE